MTAKRTDEPDSFYEPEHEDDKLCRLESQRWAQSAVDEFAEKYREQLTALIWTYADSRAHDKLDDLRDEFWSTPMNKRKGGK